MIIHDDSNKSYPLIVAHHQTFGYSIIMHQIIHYFETDTSWLLNLLTLLLLSYWFMEMINVL